MKSIIFSVGAYTVTATIPARAINPALATLTLNWNPPNPRLTFAELAEYRTKLTAVLAEATALLGVVPLLLAPEPKPATPRPRRPRGEAQARTSRQIAPAGDCEANRR